MNCESTYTSRSIMRAMSNLLSTASFRASYEETTWLPRWTSVFKRRRLATRCSPRKARSNSGKSSSMVMAVRKPRAPRLTGKRGVWGRAKRGWRRGAGGAGRAPGGARGEQGAVAAEHDNQVAAFGDFMARHAGGNGIN